MPATREALAIVPAFLPQSLVCRAQAPAVSGHAVLDVAQALHVARDDAGGQVGLDAAPGLARAARERLTLDSFLEAL